ncbi:MAG TPA: hypothetical protein VGC63_04760 [Solirubrobacterales bacterium]|jgi:hypothetical protein
MASETRVEVCFDPAYLEEWPHFIATATLGSTEVLYELGPAGWRCTLTAGGPSGLALGDVPLRNEELEDRLWAGATALTENPDAEAMSQESGSAGWVPFAGATHQ